MPGALFVSDLHLAAERPGTNERFFGFLQDQASRAERLYILGDLFEYWIGDDELQAADGDPLARAVADALHALSRLGVGIAVMHGNRDFLLGERFCAATGARLLEDPAVEKIGGVRTLLMHGDTLCTDDLDYQAWRRTARSRAWQAEFLAKSLPERRRTVQAMRAKSREVVGAKPAEIMDVNDGAVREALRTHRLTRLVHGHTHRPARHALEVDGRPCERWVLPDWYDGRGGYLAVDDAGPRLLAC
ncbi:MAG: UDP-2,3-diacylglucosamine diphosphatase [Betaproteobacteria bacterium]|nr:UDP-2,3-diacylglucosamine diphosphatase [Betaproteobacteria bacterium]MDH5352696.1 UDP-2,3-diacylglucosamine diphosphatase [Betaproteobacteria bacterium]